MIQLRNKVSALRLFDSLLAGSDRTVAVARRQAKCCFAWGLEMDTRVSVFHALSSSLVFALQFCCTSGLMDAPSHLTHQTYPDARLDTCIFAPRGWPC